MAEASWYVVHTYSGYENKVKDSIESAIGNRGLQEEILKVIIPMEEVVELKDGEAKTSYRKLFPGYVIINMVMNDDTWYVVRNTRGVTGFVGPGSKPVPLTEAEMKRLGIQDEVESESASQRASQGYSASFKEGDMIRIIKGAWKDTVGAVQRMDYMKGTATIYVELFGRETPVEISFDEVRRVD